MLITFIEAVELIIASISLFGGAMIAALWKFVFKRINKNCDDIQELEDKHDKNIKILNKKRDADYEKIKDFIGASYSLGEEEGELLVRIDERVSSMRDDLDDVKEQVDELYRNNGGGK